MSTVSLASTTHIHIFRLDINILPIPRRIPIAPFAPAPPVVFVSEQNLNRSEQVVIDDDITYSLDPITLYKEEPGMIYDQEITFTTPGSGALCGVTLEIGVEYLLGLHRHDNGHLTGDYCGLVWEWDWVEDEHEASLEDGCQGDPCNGWCGEFQVYPWLENKTLEGWCFIVSAATSTPLSNPET